MTRMDVFWLFAIATALFTYAVVVMTAFMGV